MKKVFFVLLVVTSFCFMLVMLSSMAFIFVEFFQYYFCHDKIFWSKNPATNLDQNDS